MKTPASCYARSPRPYPAKLPEPEYPSGLEVRRVRASGQFKWKGHNVFISEALRQEPIGFELIENDHWLVYFGSFPIALFDSYERAIELAGELSAAPGAGGEPIHEWLEVRPFLTAPPTVTQ